jgi:subtilisin-like proprotein convertase family protein
MNKFFSLAIVFLITISLHAQTFTWSGYRPIIDNQSDTIPITVSGMTAAITSTYGISKACFDVYHSYKSDVTISLISPDGTVVKLVENIGGSSDNFLGTCVANDGIPFANGLAPFTGIFLPIQDVNNFNNGQNPNGVWKMVVKDVATPDTGSIRFASIHFTNNPPAGNGTGGTNVGPAGPFVCATCVCPGGATGCDLLQLMK